MKPNLHVKGRILTYIGGLATVELLDQTVIQLKPRGIFRHEKHLLKPMTGDFVELVKHDRHYEINRILERSNVCIRPKVANLDAIMVVQSVTKPNLDFDNLNKTLLFYELNFEQVGIIFTKSDLLSPQETENFLKLRQIWEDDGYTCFDAHADFEKLEKFLDGKTICFAGNSGVGKSTLLNRIDPQFNRQTQEISQSLNRGKHTTTNVVLTKYKNGYLVDTPGFVKLDLPSSPHELAKGWHDFFHYSLGCHFSDCLHEENAVRCAVLEAVKFGKIHEERYQSYLRLLSSQRKNYGRK